MLLNFGVGEDPCESLGLQGDPTSPSWRKSVLNIHCKDWCWSWSSNTLATWCEELTHWKRPWCWERLKAGGEGMTEDENVGRHHRLDGHQFEQALEFVKPGVLQSMGSQRVGHDWVAELNWTCASRLGSECSLGICQNLFLESISTSPYSSSQSF